MYEYECRKCLRRFEKIERFSDAPQTLCTECGGQIERLVSAPAIRFKGTGWYVTDYARQPKTQDQPGGNGEKKSGEKKSSEKKSGEKSAAKPAITSSGDSQPAKTSPDKS